MKLRKMFVVQKRFGFFFIIFSYYCHQMQDFLDLCCWFWLEYFLILHYLNFLELIVLFCHTVFVLTLACGFLG